MTIADLLKEILDSPLGDVLIIIVAIIFLLLFIAALSAF